MKASGNPRRSGYQSSPSNSPMSSSPRLGARSPLNSPSKQGRGGINSTTSHIKVVARFRPESRDEIKGPSVDIIDIHGNTVVFKDGVSDFKGSFTFDRVFGKEVTQQQVFEYSIKDSIEDIFGGFNGTVITYGQTGSGKSYTMVGDLNDVERRGLIPRITEALFDKINNFSPDIGVSVTVSYLELYMENLKDLLEPNNNGSLLLREDGVHGLKTVGVSNSSMIHKLLLNAQNKRVITSTSMNEESSRSHTIFRISVMQTNVKEGTEKVGNLYMVDLAGSEKVRKTKATGQVLEEAKKINGSLSALGNVINALTDKSAKYIPYRDSKLTRILQSSFGGNSKTTMIINCSPSSFNEQETVSALRFGSRAKEIRNMAVASSSTSVGEAGRMSPEQIIMVETYKAQIKAMEDRLKAKDAELQVLSSTKARNEVLEQEISVLKQSGDNNSINELDDIDQLKIRLIESSVIQKNLENELETRSMTIAELERQVEQDEESSMKVEALENALLQFSSHIEQVELQNQQLCKDLVVLQQISQAREEKIESLTLQVQSQSKVVHHDTEAFEHRLNYLRTKLNSVKLSVPQQIPGKLSSQSLRTTHSQEFDTDKENIADGDTKYNFRRGLNLNVVKSLKDN